MISYLIYSTLCMGILLLFYHSVLEKEKVHHINRGYLVFGLVFSLTVPYIPVGMTGSFIPWLNGLQSTSVQPFLHATTFDGKLAELSREGIAPVTAPATSSSSLLLLFVLIVYFTVSLILFVRLFRNIDMIQLKADRNPRRRIENYEMILLSEKVVPHTFMNTIFVNKEQYENGMIGDEVILHELTHARQKHTLDILFVELLKTLLWFNPILYFYKKAILLNHEFIADQAVITSGTPISRYQTLLLNTLLVQPVHDLSNNFNYTLTKKRLYMMTQTTTRLWSFLKITLLIPLFVALGLILGCEPSTSVFSENEIASREINIEFSDSGMIIVNDEEMHISAFETYFSNLTDTPESAHIYASPNTPLGEITKVQNVIRLYGIKKSNYLTVVNPGQIPPSSPPSHLSSSPLPTSPPPPSSSPLR